MLILERVRTDVYGTTLDILVIVSYFTTDRSDESLTKEFHHMSTPPATNRTRTFSWENPMVGAQAAMTMSGLEYLQAMVRGELPPPPMMALMNIGAGDIEEGRVVFTVDPAEYHYNPIGSVHGGVACTLFDSAMGCAVHSMLPAGVGYTTLELKVNFLRPLSVDTGRVLCEGKVIHVGSRVATAEGKLFDAAGNLYGHATTTCIIFRP
jgi:uncharacterized protein (TIGR00369 family)